MNRRIGPLGLHIDESSYQTNSQFINLLDVQYCFDIEGKLQTDLYVKETDSRSYLNFSSAHPNHTFSGNVYSQSLRLRRIINDDERLRKRLKELSKAFKEAGYPEKMVTEITNKVQNSARNITTQAKEESEDSGQIIVVSTFEADKNIVDAVKRSEDSLKNAKFRNTAWAVVQVCQKSRSQHKMLSGGFRGGGKGAMALGPALCLLKKGPALSTKKYIL